MKRPLAQLALVLLLTATLYAADTLDRIVATVNKRPILASDVDDEAHFEALQQGKAADSLDAERKAVLNRLIERELVFQQIPQEFDPGKEVIDGRLAEMRKQFPSVVTDRQWNDLLASYDLDETTLHDEIKQQLQVLHFLDLRLKPTVRVDRDEIRDYYTTKLVPRLQTAGATVDPLDKVQEKIAEVLLQQKMTEVFDAWIANLRNQGNIHILDPSLMPSTVAVEKGTRTTP
jgi:SurA N-terminal domain